MAQFMKPEEWLVSCLGMKGPAENFKVVSIKEHNAHGKFTSVRVLHKESGAVWEFACMVEREGVI